MLKFWLFWWEYILLKIPSFFSDLNFLVFPSTPFSMLLIIQFALSQWILCLEICEACWPPSVFIVYTSLAVLVLVSALNSVSLLPLQCKVTVSLSFLSFLCFYCLLWLSLCYLLDCFSFFLSCFQRYQLWFYGPTVFDMIVLLELLFSFSCGVISFVYE